MTTNLDVQVAIRPDQCTVAQQRFVESPRALLGDGARRTVDLWQTHVRVGRIRRPVVVSLGPVRAAVAPAGSAGPREHVRSMRWRPERPGLEGGMIPDPRFPSFVGRIALVVDGGGTLSLRGTYQPPGGHLGNLVDGLFLHKAAEATALDLLQDIRARLVADEDPASTSPNASGAERQA